MKKSTAPQLKRYDIKALQHAINFPLAKTLESIGLKFSVGGLKMDEDGIWSIDLKFEDVFETFFTSYNMVIVRNFRPGSEYLMFLEPTVPTFSEEKKQTIAVPKVIYDTLDFYWDKLNQDDFLI